MSEARFGDRMVTSARQCAATRSGSFRRLSRGGAWCLKGGLAFALLAIVAWPVPPAGAATAAYQAPDAACPASDDLLALGGRLDRVVARARSGETITILAIGSSSTAGVGASSPAHTYPALLAAYLAARLPDVPVTVVNRGIGGEVSANTAARLPHEVDKYAPDLVIWQVGTNDAVRGVGLTSMETTIEEGVAMLRARGLDVVLMDPQLFPKVEGSERYEAVVDEVSRLGEETDVPVLHRFEAMQRWAALPAAVRKGMLSKDQFHMNDLGYSCIAAMLGEGLVRRIEDAGGGTLNHAHAPAPLDRAAAPGGRMAAVKGPAGKGAAKGPAAVVAVSTAAKPAALDPAARWKAAMIASEAAHAAIGEGSEEPAQASQ
ncbi:SGNH/GDSL hydrolase family protein [Segnochrobactrum spirostomi]|nr:SGNH/GDSL hydrolase family protein [Segnochrobactrum spirostomi]